MDGVRGGGGMGKRGGGFLTHDRRLTQEHRGWDMVPATRGSGVVTLEGRLMVVGARSWYPWGEVAHIY